MDLKYPASVESNGNNIELYHFKHNADKLDFDNVQALSQATVVPRESKLRVDFLHQIPALLGEWYEIKVVVTNEELYEIVDLKIEAWIEEEIANGEILMKQ